MFPPLQVWKPHIWKLNVIGPQMKTARIPDSLHRAGPPTDQEYSFWTSWEQEIFYHITADRVTQNNTHAHAVIFDKELGPKVHWYYWSIWKAWKIEACQPHLEMEYDPIILLWGPYLLTGALPAHPIQSNHPYFLLHFASLPGTSHCLMTCICPFFHVLFIYYFCLPMD